MLNISCVLTEPPMTVPRLQVLARLIETRVRSKNHNVAQEAGMENGFPVDGQLVRRNRESGGVVEEEKKNVWWFGVAKNSPRCHYGDIPG